jgi:ABC-type branched-subunit amino acid transport system permease subunit
VASGPQSSGWIADALRHWVIVPKNATLFGNIGFVALLCLVIALVQTRGAKRLLVMVPTIYLAACVWEARLVAQPSITRQILLGAILIVMMNARPHGLLGSRRVEVV